MYRLIKDDEGRIRWRIEVEFDAGFEGDTGTVSTYDTLRGDVERAFWRITKQLRKKEVPCPECGELMTLAREYLDNEETGNWYAICDECGYSAFGENALAKLERKHRNEKE